MAHLSLNLAGSVYVHHCTDCKITTMDVEGESDLFKLNERESVPHFIFQNMGIRAVEPGVNRSRFDCFKDGRVVHIPLDEIQPVHPCRVNPLHSAIIRCARSSVRVANGIYSLLLMTQSSWASRTREDQLFLKEKIGEKYQCSILNIEIRLKEMKSHPMPELQRILERRVAFYESLLLNILNEIDRLKVQRV